MYVIISKSTQQIERFSSTAAGKGNFAATTKCPLTSRPRQSTLGIEGFHHLRSRSSAFLPVIGRCNV